MRPRRDLRLLIVAFICATTATIGCGSLLASPDGDDVDPSPPPAPDGSAPNDADPSKDDGGADATTDGPATLLADVRELGESSVYPNPSGVAVGAASIFVSADNGVILTRDKGPTSIDLGTPLYSNLNDPRGLALFNSDIFWCETAASSVERGAADGTANSRLKVAIAVGATGIAIAGETAWITGYGADTLYSTPRDSILASATVAATLDSGDKPEGVAVGAGLVYVALNGKGEVVSFEVGNPPSTRRHVITLDRAGGLAFDELANVMYLTSQSSDPAKRGVYRWRKDAIDAELVVPTADVPAGIAFDDQYVYWVTRGSAGRLWRANK